VNNGIFLNVLDLSWESKLAMSLSDGGNGGDRVLMSPSRGGCRLRVERLRRPKVHKYLVRSCDGEDKRTEEAAICGLDSGRRRMTEINGLKSYVRQDVFGPSQ
jgi:hypothetical protein